MAPLPSAIRGNWTSASSERILMRPPSFEKYMRSSHHVQHRPLQPERRFSHYEQKVNSAPLENMHKKIPRLLQTRRHAGGRLVSFTEEKIMWNERLAAWIDNEKKNSKEYIKISDGYSLIVKQLYFCSACHEFFHLHLRDRNEKPACPRFKDRHTVHPVSVRKIRKTEKKIKSNQPPTVAKDPFADRRNIRIPSLQPPPPAKPRKKPERIIVDLPRLPTISKSSQRTLVATVASTKSKIASAKNSDRSSSSKTSTTRTESTRFPILSPPESVKGTIPLFPHETNQHNNADVNPEEEPTIQRESSPSPDITNPVEDVFDTPDDEVVLELMNGDSVESELVEDNIENLQLEEEKPESHDEDCSDVDEFCDVEFAVESISGEEIDVYSELALDVFSPVFSGSVVLCIVQ